MSVDNFSNHYTKTHGDEHVDYTCLNIDYIEIMYSIYFEISMLSQIIISISMSPSLNNKSAFLFQIIHF